ncbi:MAG: hypothetical protein AB7O24_08205 [Kofleriaceae bacterium]
MTRRHLQIALAIVVMSEPVVADPTRAIVMRSEGSADPGVRASIDGALMNLAKTENPSATLGDISYSDAAAAVGCDPTKPSCQNDVLGFLTVDELVYATATASPSSVDIVVRRVTKAGSRDAKMTLAAGQPVGRLDAIAPLFGVRVPAAEPTAPAAPPLPPPPSPEPAPAPVDSTSPGSDDATSGPMEIEPVEPAPLLGSDDPLPTEDTSRRRLELTGMIGGGVFAFAGAIMWIKAAGIQSEIDDAPTRTRVQVEHLLDLERRGDRYALWGNVMVVGGLVLGGVSAVFYWKDRRDNAGTTTALRVHPVVFDHGVGIGLSTGASP